MFNPRLEISLDKITYNTKRVIDICRDFRIEIVEIADISLNSEIKIIHKLSKATLKEGKPNKIILMIDVGDLREEIFLDKEEEIMEVVNEISQLNGVKLIGLGTNLTCFRGIAPSKDNLRKLIEIRSIIQEKFNIALEILSGSNSSSLHLVRNASMLKGINQLRLGTSIVIGAVEIGNMRIDDTYIDAFRLVADKSL